jgi:hypothetical protein
MRIPGGRWSDSHSNGTLGAVSLAG